jgi:hypothetical protein
MKANNKSANANAVAMCSGKVKTLKTSTNFNRKFPLSFNTFVYLENKQPLNYLNCVINSSFQAEMKRDANSRDTSQRMKRNFIGDSEKH